MSAPMFDDVALPVTLIWGREIAAPDYRTAAAACAPEEVLVVVLKQPAGASIAVRCPDAATWRRLVALKTILLPYAVPALRLMMPLGTPPREAAVAPASLPLAPRPARRRPVPRLFPHLQVCAPWYRAVWAGLVWVIRPALLDWGLIDEREDKS